MLSLACRPVIHFFLFLAKLMADSKKVTNRKTIEKVPSWAYVLISISIIVIGVVAVMLHKEKQKGKKVSSRIT